MDRGTHLSSASTKSKKNSETLFSKFKVALAGLAITFAGAAISTWFSDRSSTWAAYVAKVDKDADATLLAYRNAADLINGRWYALYQTADAIENSVSGDEWERARQQYSVVDKDWAAGYTKIDSDIRFNVDETFQVNLEAERENADTALISAMACAKTSSADKSRQIYETNSAHEVMAIVNHCLGLVKADLDKAIAARSGAGSDPSKAKDLLGKWRDELELAYWTHAALRCFVLERELTLRSIAVRQSYWNKFFGALPVRYDLPRDAENCRAAWLQNTEKADIEVSGVPAQLD